MNAQQAREHYLSYMEIFHERRLDKLAHFYAQDVVVHPTLPQPGLEGLHAILGAWVTAFPDLRLMVDEVIYSDGILATRITIKGTHTGGPWMGVPPSGRAVKYIDHCFYRLRDGKFTEVWDLPDTWTLMQQMGALPAP
jgi:steroid delta-isomerase-like uncharacterized protein